MEVTVELITNYIKSIIIFHKDVLDTFALCFFSIILILQYVVVVNNVSTIMIYLSL